ncbi:MAG: crotonase/enoyl-CoA hydratase family protein [Gammaproteobacteria bacterium]|nr:crotonase/enoyl-CoA hydratase family protein [Gammaproteobacteria bacterium]MCP5200165.1 crotonase/enoyl-CoA hydratase family protein [Gammaproteobacteria bacterium]
MRDRLHYALDGEVAVLTMDDGKANAAGFAMLEALDTGLQRARDEARAVVLAGRPGVFCGGFDLGVIRAGDDAVVERLVTAGARLLMRLYGHPQPVVLAVTGHAVALGGFLLLAADYRYGADGDYRVGLNETAIGLRLPVFGFELIGARVASDWRSRVTLGAELFAPAAACTAGFLDAIVADPRAAAIERARALAAYDAATYAFNKHGLRAALIGRVLASLPA